MASVAALAGIIVRIFWRYDSARTILAMMGACYTCSAFIGIPVIVMAFGQSSPVVIITLFQVIVATTTILTGIEVYQKHGVLSWRAAKEISRTVLLNPIVGGSLLGILLAVQRWDVPIIMERSLRLLGGAGIPTALFALGLSLADRQKTMPANTAHLVNTLVFLKQLSIPFSRGLWVVMFFISTHYGSRRLP